MAPQGGVRLPQPHQLPFQLVLQLASHVIALDRDAGPRVPPRQHAVRLAQILVLYGKGVGRVAPLSFGEDQRGAMTGAHPAANGGLEGREQVLVHRIADEQRVHVGAPGDVRPFPSRC